MATTPDSGAVGRAPSEASFRFDEVVSERPAGAADLARLFIISPRAGLPRVAWHRERLDVRPPKGWRPNSVYTITLLPGLSDLRGNVNREGATIVFSTGAKIPNTLLGGVVYDWAAGTPIARAQVEAVAQWDTTTVYAARADSLGRFALRYLPAGVYLVRGWNDANSNLALDAREMWDSSRVSLADTARLELLAFTHDSSGARIANVAVVDSLTLRVTLSQPLSPAQPLTPAFFALRAADSSLVAIAAVQRAAAFDSAQRAADSSARREADSAAARGPNGPGAMLDSAARARAADSLRGARVGGAVRFPTAPGARPVTPGARPAVPPPSPTRPVPPSELVLVVSAPLEPGATYRLEARGLVGLGGVAATSSRDFTVPRPAPAPAPAPRRP